MHSSVLMIIKNGLDGDATEIGIGRNPSSLGSLSTVLD